LEREPTVFENRRQTDTLKPFALRVWIDSPGIGDWSWAWSSARIEVIYATIKKPNENDDAMG
jgi:hypothetical protein